MSTVPPWVSRWYAGEPDPEPAERPTPRKRSRALATTPKRQDALNAVRNLCRETGHPARLAAIANRLGVQPDCRGNVRRTLLYRLEQQGLIAKQGVGYVPLTLGGGDA